MKSYVVIGLGRFGTTLARQLCALGGQVLAIDIHSDLVQHVANDVTQACADEREVRGAYVR